MKSQRGIAVSGILMSVVLASIGCGPSDNSLSEVRELNKSNIQKMANAYRIYAIRYDHKGPGSIEELKDFLSTNKTIKRNLNRIGISLGDLDSYFVSDADGEEFDFRWGVRIDPLGSNAPLVFEKIGKDGIRRVALANGIVVDVDSDKKYNEMKAGKISASDVPAVQGPAGAD